MTNAGRVSGIGSRILKPSAPDVAHFGQHPFAECGLVAGQHAALGHAAQPGELAFGQLAGGGNAGFANFFQYFGRLSYLILNSLLLFIL